MKLFAVLSLAEPALAATNTYLSQHRRADAVVEALEKENAESMFRELMFASMSMSMPSSPPTPYPTTSPPTSQPTLGETTPTPTPVPTVRPTPNPTPGTPAPTVRPTPKPTMPVPTPTPPPTPIGPFEELEGCQTAYAYCEDWSQCFPPGSSWGWNIDLAIDLASAEVDDELYLECPVVAGAGQCDLEKGQVVGKLIITEFSVRWEFGANNAADEFHLYAGVCPWSDAGNHLTNEDGSCSYTASSPGEPGKYTLGKEVEEGDPMLEDFQFDISNFGTYMKNNSPWKDAEYSPFPVGSDGHRFLAAHAHVCGCSGDERECIPSEEPEFVRSGGEPTSGTAGITPGATAVIVLVVFSAFVVVGFLTYRRYSNKRAGSSESISSSSVSNFENENMVDVAL